MANLKPKKHFVLLYTTDERVIQNLQVGLQSSQFHLEYATTAELYKWEVTNLNFDVILFDHTLLPTAMVPFTRQSCLGKKCKTPILILADSANRARILDENSIYENILTIERPWTIEFMLKTLEIIINRQDQCPLIAPSQSTERHEPICGKLYLQPGEVLITKGDISDRTMYYIEDGEMIIYGHDDEGKHEVVLDRVKKGEVVGEISFLDDQPRCASVKALVPTRVTVINDLVYDKVIRDQPIFMKALVLTLCQKLRQTNRRVKV